MSQFWGTVKYTPEGYLTADGKHQVRVEKAEFASTASGKELFKLSLVVPDGTYQGEKCQVAYFYDSKEGMERFKAFIFKVDKAILDIQDENLAQAKILAKLHGALLEIKQSTSKDGDKQYIEVVKYLEGPTIPQSQPVLQNGPVMF
jgi:hypothetical protein